MSNNSCGLFSKLVQVVSLIAFSCSPSHEDEEKYFSQITNNDFRTIEANVTVVGDTAVLKDPRKLFLIDKYLIIADHGFSRNIRVFDTTTFKLVAELGEYGNGNGKLLSTKDIFEGPTGSDFYVYDITQRKLVNFSIDSLASANYRYTKEIEFPDRELWNLLSVEVLDDTTFVGTVMNGSGRLVYFNENKIIGYKGNLPENIHNSSPYVYGHSFRADLIKFNSRLVTPFFFTDIVQFFNLQGDPIQSYHGPDKFWPIYNVKNQSSLETLPETTVAFLNGTSNSTVLYTLYRGKNARNHIYCFDAAFKPYGKFVISAELQSIACNDHKLFGLADVDTTPKLVRIDI